MSPAARLRTLIIASGDRLDCDADGEIGGAPDQVDGQKREDEAAAAHVTSNFTVEGYIRPMLTCQQVFDGYTSRGADRGYAFDLSGGRLCLSSPTPLAIAAPTSRATTSATSGDFIASAEQAGATTARAARGLLTRGRGAAGPRARVLAAEGSAFGKRSTGCSPRSPRGARRGPDLAIVNGAVPAAFDAPGWCPQRAAFR